ncbi:hypothetical protein GGI16_002338, partial [Coemansia sp. S142-1]
MFSRLSASARVASTLVRPAVVGRRFESTVKVGDAVSASSTSRLAQEAPKKKRPIGGFRGG